jgi:hypothetical protein
MLTLVGGAVMVESWALAKKAKAAIARGVEKRILVDLFYSRELLKDVSRQKLYKSKLLIEGDSKQRGGYCPQGRENECKRLEHDAHSKRVKRAESIQQGKGGDQRMVVMGIKAVYELDLLCSRAIWCGTDSFLPTM